MTRLVVISLLFAAINVNEISASCEPQPRCELRFPKGFIFASATAAYQVEGAAYADGKGESIWDKFTHQKPSPIVDNSTGDVACDSYYRYKEDVKLLKLIGYKFYRFSISWPRILPNGDRSYINRAGIDHYHRVIDYLLENGIQPVVTMYHWDLPQKLQNMGGWLNRKIIGYANEYADVLFAAYGNKVKWWITYNEPKQVVAGYIGDYSAPGLNLNSPADYNVAHHILLSHAAIYRLYNDKYRCYQNGKVGITIDCQFSLPANPNSEADREAAERANQFQFGWFAHPIFSRRGGYPPIMREVVDENSLLEGRRMSRLPRFTKKEAAALRGAYDFFGLNHYTSNLTVPGAPPSNGPYTYFQDLNVTLFPNPKWPSSASVWLKVYPPGFRAVLNWIKNEYDNPKVFVTENGFSDLGQLNDTDRISYYYGYLKEMSYAIYKDKCNVIGHTSWALIDNFEWSSGYTVKFGLVYVNFDSPERRRIPKKSAYYWRDILKLGCLIEG